MERDGVIRRSGVAAIAVAAATGAALVVWLGQGLLASPGADEAATSPGRLAAGAAPASQASQPTRAPSEPVRLSTYGNGLLLAYPECPAKCLVDVLEHYHPQAAIGAWCSRRAAERYVCVSVVDDATVDLYECRAWLVRTDRRRGIELLKTGPAKCPSRPVTANDTVAR